eukprot:EG_transcript_1005
MWGLWATLRPMANFNRFADAELEHRFQHDYQTSNVHSSHLFAAISFSIVGISSVGAVIYMYPITDPIFWSLFSISLLCGFAALLLPRHVPGPHLPAALASVYCVSLAAQGVQYSLFLEWFRCRGWGVPEEDRDVVDQATTFLVMYMFNLNQQIQILPLLHVGFCPATLVNVFAGPLVNLFVISLGMPLRAKSFLFCPLGLFLAAVNAWYSQNVSHMRRSIFLLELQKARQIDETQRADAMINHIVKNVMVEAAGYIDAFLELCVPPPPTDLKSYLLCSLERLRSGMAWCKRRRVLLAVMNHEAKPHPAPTSLAALGSALVSHRCMTTGFTDIVVDLDEALTDLVLENAISNAFRHGHPTDPDVRFFIAADPAASPCIVTFRITNRSHPARQPLTADLVERLLHGHRLEAFGPSASCSEGLGLQHCVQAAQLQGMAVSLAQEGDTVVFQASIATQVIGGVDASVVRSSSLMVTEALPPGLRISVIDDSMAACTLLKHQLSRDIVGCVVETFGACAEDVDAFLSHTLLGADVAILDQHLDWPSGALYLGTDLVRLLVRAGFRGLICIRSANVSDQDTQQYFAAGVHCVLDKLLDRTQMVATLTNHYWRFLGGPHDVATVPLSHASSHPDLSRLPGPPDRRWSTSHPGGGPRASLAPLPGPGVGSSALVPTSPLSLLQMESEPPLGICSPCVDPAAESVYSEV